MYTQNQIIKLYNELGVAKFRKLMRKIHEDKNSGWEFLDYGYRSQVFGPKDGKWVVKVARRAVRTCKIVVPRPYSKLKHYFLGYSYLSPDQYMAIQSRIVVAATMHWLDVNRLGNRLVSKLGSVYAGRFDLHSGNFGLLGKRLVIIDF